MRNDPTNPFRGRAVPAAEPMRVLHRFTKPGHVAEIRERTVTAFAALEWLVFVDGSLIESQLFHAARVERYRPELEARIAQFVDAGWVDVPLPSAPFS